MIDRLATMSAVRFKRQAASPILRHGGLVTLIALSALLAGSLTACGNSDDDNKGEKAGLLPPSNRVAALPPLTATPSPQISVVPNGPWEFGVNGATILGVGSAEGAAARVQIDSGKKVRAVLALKGGVWVYSVPSLPSIDGGLRELQGPVLAVFFVLGE